MRQRRVALFGCVLLLPLLALLAACSSSNDSANAGAKAGAATVCALLDAAQMSRIMGETLTAEPHDEKLATLGHSECHYFGASHERFRIMVSIQRSNVAAFVSGLKIPPPGAAAASDPYADLGQGAKSIGPMVYILGRSGLIGISSRAAFVDNPDTATRHRIAEQILHALDPPS